MDDSVVALPRFGVATKVEDVAPLPAPQRDVGNRPPPDQWPMIPRPLTVGLQGLSRIAPRPHGHGKSYLPSGFSRTQVDDGTHLTGCTQTPGHQGVNLTAGTGECAQPGNAEVTNGALSHGPRPASPANHPRGSGFFQQGRHTPSRRGEVGQGRNRKQ